MTYLGRFSPVRAYRDLRSFLATRERHELGFLVLAMAITGFLIYAFEKDSSVPVEYHRDIVYVQQWDANRTDAEIRAQQKIDGPLKAKRLAEEEAARRAKQAQFKKVDDAMTKWGL
jgi:hypothetical protein